jgi:cytoskeletal protein RodZ
MSNFGASFRKARESAGLPLDRIASETRISTRFLLAIESEDFHLLPGGVFNRGFVRAYAAHLGMDPDQAVSEYSRISAGSDEVLDSLRDGELASARRAQRSLYPIIGIILLLLIGVYYFVTRGAASKAVETSPPTVQQTVAPAAVEPTPAAVESPIPTALPASPTAAPEAKPAATSASPFASAPLVLEVDIKELTWIRIATDGAVALNDSVAPGTVRRFLAERSIDVTLGNAGGANMKINGRDMGQLGARGQVRQFKITPQNASQIQG